jgi:hypothetical protein
MKNCFLLLAFAFLFSLNVSCQTKKENVEIPEYIINGISRLSSTPDSLLTSEQMDLKKKFFKIMSVSLKLENNKIINKSKPEDFEKQGLSKYYYYLLEKNVNEVNNFELRNKSISDIYSDIMKELNRLLSL